MDMENPVWMCVKTKNYNTCMYSKLNLKKQILQRKELVNGQSMIVEGKD